MPRPHVRQFRNDRIKVMARIPDPESGKCVVYDCREPSRGATSGGLDHRFCRRHADHYSRHGSPYKGSYKAAQVNPYRRAAIEWIMAHPDDIWASNAVLRVAALYQTAGPFIPAFRLRGLPPRDRARNAWARLRRFEVDPRVVVAAWLAVEMVIADDRQPVSTTEVKRVQAAKIVHRLASGTHKRWPNSPGAPEMHKYPASRGNVLRHIGADLQGAVELLVDHRLGAIRRHAATLVKSSRTTTPHPRSVKVRRRSKA